jgi:hypothetical protein
MGTRAAAALRAGLGRPKNDDRGVFTRVDFPGAMGASYLGRLAPYLEVFTRVVFPGAMGVPNRGRLVGRHAALELRRAGPGTANQHAGPDACQLLMGASPAPEPAGARYLVTHRDRDLPASQDALSQDRGLTRQDRAITCSRPCVRPPDGTLLCTLNRLIPWGTTRQRRSRSGRTEERDR